MDIGVDYIVICSHCCSDTSRSQLSANMSGALLIECPCCKAALSIDIRAAAPSPASTSSPAASTCSSASASSPRLANPKREAKRSLSSLARSLSVVRQSMQTLKKKQQQQRTQKAKPPSCPPPTHLLPPMNLATKTTIVGRSATSSGGSAQSFDGLEEKPAIGAKKRR